MYEAVEDGLPFLVAGEIVVGDEKTPQALGEVGAHNIFYVVGGAGPRHAALHVDDRAERALVGAAAPGVEARHPAHRAPRFVGSNQRSRRTLDCRQIIHEIVERFEAPGQGIAQHLIETSFRFAGEQRRAERLGPIEIRICTVQHADDAGDVEAADGDLDAALTQRPRDVESAGKLVLIALRPASRCRRRILDHGSNAIGTNAGVGLVEGVHVDFDVVAQSAALGAVFGKAVERGERIRRNRGAEPSP